LGLVLVGFFFGFWWWFSRFGFGFFWSFLAIFDPYFPFYFTAGGKGLFSD
jgi:hypothetical protein